MATSTKLPIITRKTISDEWTFQEFGGVRFYTNKLDKFLINVTEEPTGMSVKFYKKGELKKPAFLITIPFQDFWTQYATIKQVVTDIYDSLVPPKVYFKSKR